jgi:hypothetical protein
MEAHLRGRFAWSWVRVHIKALSNLEGAMLFVSLMSSMHFYAWNKGLKTGMYYLRTKAKARAQQFTMDQRFSVFKRQG